MKNADTNATRTTRSTIFRFRSHKAAFNWAARAADQGLKAMGVMHGDDGRYWVCSLADCSRLEKAGYEWAPR